MAIWSTRPHVISRATHSDHSFDQRNDFLVLFTPVLREDSLHNWLEQHQGRTPAAEFYGHEPSAELGFVRSHHESGQPGTLIAWHQGEIEYRTLTRRRNFALKFRRPEEKTSQPCKAKQNLPRTCRHPVEDCTVDRLPLEVARLNLLRPIVLQHLENSWITQRLLQTVLRDVPFQNLDLVVTAISPPALQWASDYEAFEFLGDAVLKMVVSCQLYYQHKNWPEGYLTQKRAMLVSNSYLARAALDAGLAPFIRASPISWKKWTPALISDLEKVNGPARTMKTKVLADVVEALIGAAFVDGGIAVARKCIGKFLPDINPQPPSFDSSPGKKRPLGDFGRLESVVGHSFENPLLLYEALTHPSCERDSSTQSYQRLEFLGDALLDIIVATYIRRNDTLRRPGEMTRVKAALVNGYLLGFFCMDFAWTDHFRTVNRAEGNRFQVLQETRQVHLWQLMRHHSESIREHRSKTIERFQSLRESIQQSLRHGISYPWAELTALRPDKFFSDIIESLLGAIYVDSEGSLDPCVSFLDRIGIIRYLDRVITDDIDVVHPRTKLDWKTGAKTVEYDVSAYNVAAADEMQRRHRCALVVAGERVLEMEGFETSDEAIVAAANVALKFL